MKRTKRCPNDKKTVIVLDRSKLSARDSNVKFDLAVKDATAPNKIRLLGSTTKKMWTWSAEAVFEIRRVVGDLYPKKNKLIRVTVADDVCKMMEDSWPKELYSNDELLDIMGEIDPISDEDATRESNILGAATLAVEALIQLTDRQKVSLQKISRKRRKTVRAHLLKRRPVFKNNGSLIIFTGFQTDEELRNLEHDIAKMLHSKNAATKDSSTQGVAKIRSLKVYFVNLYPKGETNNVVGWRLEQSKFSPRLSTYAVSRDASFTREAVHALVMAAYDLVSTTVSNIPMKEDNNASMNYDVELLHSRRAHYLLEAMQYMPEPQNGKAYETTRLSWATVSKIQWNRLFSKVSHMVPCTPAHPTTRPSQCLTQFVTGGRTVMLDLPLRVEDKISIPPNVNKNLISHVLKAHRGYIFLHAIGFRKLMRTREYRVKTAIKRRMQAFKSGKYLEMLKNEDAIEVTAEVEAEYKEYEKKRRACVRLQPLGPKLPDYPPCLNAYRWLLKNIRIKPRSQEVFLTSAEKVVSDPRVRLARMTRNFPKNRKESALFQHSANERFEPLFKILSRKEINADQYKEAHSVIVRLRATKNARTSFFTTKEKNDCYPLKAVAGSSDAELNLAFTQCEVFLRNFVNHSPVHEQIYVDFVNLLEIKNTPSEIPDVKIRPMRRNKCRLGGMKKYKEREEKRKQANPSKIPVAYVSDSNRALPPACKRSNVLPANQWKVTDAISLWDKLCDEAEQNVSAKRQEFEKREQYGNQAAQYLYPALRAQKEPSPNQDSGPPSDPRVRKN